MSPDPKDEFLKNLGIRIKQSRIDKNMTLQELSDAVGYTNRSTIATIEAGKQDITSFKLFAISKVLNVSTDYLLGIENGGI